MLGIALIDINCSFVPYHKPLASDPESKFDKRDILFLSGKLPLYISKLG